MTGPFEEKQKQTWVLVLNTVLIVLGIYLMLSGLWDSHHVSYDGKFDVGKAYSALIDMIVGLFALLAARD